MSVPSLITQHLDVWTSAIETRSTAGRGSSNKLNLYGIKKLRELILELAVRGQLVPQDPDDEPASILLEKIAAEKVRLIKDGKLKKQEPLPPITDDEKPFELPEGWEWTRLDMAFNLIIDCPHSTPKFQDKGFLCLDTNSFKQGSLLNHKLRFVSKETFESRNTRLKPEFRDIVFAREGSVGEAIVIPTHIECCLGQRVMLFRPSEKLNAEFMRLVISSPLTLRLLLALHKGIGAKHVNVRDMKFYAVSLPPAEEQHRIVAKVNELMSLCDALEQEQAANIAAHQTLVEELLAALTSSTPNSPPSLTLPPQGVEGTREKNRAALLLPSPLAGEGLGMGGMPAWARIATHFDTLFTTEHSIDQLKQTILQLAVMGKLVPQDPNDEPASVLLQKIAAEKARLINTGKIKKEKPLPAITEDEKPFELPNGWEWCRLNDLALESEAGWSPLCKPNAREGDTWGVLKVSAVTWGVFKPNENKELPSELEPKNQYEVHPGDFLISRANTAELVAKAVVVPENSPKKLIMSDKIIRFVFSEKISNHFINLVNNSLFSRAYYMRVAGGTSSSMKNVSREQVRNLTIALPPLAEQHRIVAKVDELMALCDAMKAQISAAQATQLQLADALAGQIRNVPQTISVGACRP